jgi:hypothetical protein
MTADNPPWPTMSRASTRMKPSRAGSRRRSQGALADNMSAFAEGVA